MIGSVSAIPMVLPRKSLTPAPQSQPATVRVGGAGRTSRADDAKLTSVQNIGNGETRRTTLEEWQQRGREEKERMIAFAEKRLEVRQMQIEHAADAMARYPKVISGLEEQAQSAGPADVGGLRSELKAYQQGLIETSKLHAQLTDSWPDFKAEMEANIARWQAELDAG